MSRQIRARTLRRKYFFILTQLLLILIVLIDFASSDPTSLRVPASEILTKIKDGQPVGYDHVTITGDLMLPETNAETLRKSNNCQFFYKTE